MADWIVSSLFVIGASLPIFICYLFLLITTKRIPNLKRSEGEKTFFDPVSKSYQRFPSLQDDPSIYLSLIVPAYKEENRLSVMMDETMAYFEERQMKDKRFTYEVIIVDDGSPDATSQVALKYVEKYSSNKVRLLKFDQNRGKGGAVRFGMLSARGERLLFADADGATDIKDLDKVEKEMDKMATDWTVPAIAIGSRAHLQEEAVVQRSVFRNVLMHVFHFGVYVLFTGDIKDTQCGFKLFTRAAARPLFKSLHVERWAFDVELIYIAQCLKMPIVEVAVNWKEIDGSKIVPLWSGLQMGKDLLLVRLRYMFRIWTMSSMTKKDE